MYFVLKTETFAKLFFLVSCTGLFIYTVLVFYTFHTAFSGMFQVQKYENVPHTKASIMRIPDNIEELVKYRSDLKYILVWSSDEMDDIGEGNQPFIAQDCFCTNCYITTNKTLLGEDYRKFDAIIFDIKLLVRLLKKNLPKSRSSHQKYIFYSRISSDDIPVCNIYADNYFNWTWSYKLDSDIFAPFIEVKNLQGNVIAPKSMVHWNPNMILLNESEIERFKHKKKAVAWVVSKCETKNDRMIIAKRMQRLFRSNSLQFDIFGCGNEECPSEGCLKVIERDYYFYYAPEDSNSKDYVTSEVVVGYDNYAVPIVNGAADYKKFIPGGSYINAAYAPGDRLAALVEYIIKNPKIYYSFHRWRNHYTIQETNKFKGLCEVCNFLNDENKFQFKSVKENFRKWWFSRPLYSRCMPKGTENLSDALSYLNEPRHY